LLKKPTKPHIGKKKFGRKSLFFVNLMLVMIPVTYFGYQPLLRYSASAIIIDSEPEKADAILLLAGGEPGRVRGAADLYREKWAPVVVVTQEPVSSDTVELRAAGIDIVTGLDNTLRILRGLDVPPEKIIRIDASVQSTMEELARMRELSERNNWKSIIVLTSNYHTRRTRLLARYTFGSAIKFVVVGSNHGGINRDAWWKNHDDVRTFMIEFEKLVAYTLYIWPRLIF
jgi:uncharacterized SAM-binding protein YcdF (DUF218 family)